MGLIGAGIGALLGIRGGWLGSIAGSVLGSYVEDRLRGRRTRRSGDGAPEVRAAPASSSYAVLGLPPTAGDADLRAAYHEKAKRLHPDALRAQGLTEEQIARANEQMARLNAAWAEIRKERGL